MVSRRPPQVAVITTAPPTQLWLAKETWDQDYKPLARVGGIGGVKFVHDTVREVTKVGMKGKRGWGRGGGSMRLDGTSVRAVCPLDIQFDTIEPLETSARDISRINNLSV